MGRPLGGTKNGEPMAFLLSLVGTDATECIAWPFGGGAYGSVYVDGETRRANRVACELKHGPPPTDEHRACHSCGEGLRGCINPNHLYWGTDAENGADVRRHGSRKGERHGRAKLTDEDIRTIRASYRRGDGPALAKRFGVSESTINYALRGHTWSHVQ